MSKINIISIFKAIKTPSLVLLLLLVFKKIIELSISNYLVNPIFSKIEYNFLNDIIFVVLFVFIILLILKKISINYYISLKHLFISSIIIGFYLYYRLGHEPWTFIGLSICSYIKYLDLILVFFTGVFIIKIFNNKTSLTCETEHGFYLDSPIGQNGHDLLNRESLAKYISNEISNTLSKDASFAIGISSEWGSGKTSFFDLLEKNLKSDSNILIKINPWINHDSRNIIKDFFDSLSSKLSEYNSDISLLIKKYSNLLVGLENKDLNKFINPLINFTDTKATTTEEFKAIDEAIKNIQKRVVVFIDDLDRLYKEEIIQVVKIIRNSANFGNTVFIVAYDRNYIINAIKGINSHNPEFFLEKIFQLEITLPNFENQIIQKKIFELISPRVTDEDRQELTSLLLNKQSHFGKNIFNSGTLTTLRDATRFSNSFLLAYNYLKGEIVLTDLLNLEALRLKYPGVYKLIFFQNDKFLETKTNSYQKTYYSLREIKPEAEKDGKLVIKEYLNKNPEKAGISDTDIEKAISLLNSLFPDRTDSLFYKDINLLSIANPLSFERYSHYRLLDSNLSEIEFSNFRNKSLKEFCSKIDEWVSNGLRWELKNKLETISTYSDKEDYEKIINSIFHFARIPKVGKLNNDFSGFDYVSLYSKIIDDKNLISSKYYGSKDDYILFITEIFRKAPSPFLFEAEFIYLTLDQFSITYNFIIPKETIEEIRFNYFKDYLSKAKTLDSNIWDLYYYNKIIESKPQGGGSFKIYKTNNPETTRLLVEFIKNKALDEYLRITITVLPFENNFFGISEIVKEMFGSFEEFEIFLDQFKEEDYQYLKEFKIFYAQLKDVNFGRAINFKFKDIPIGTKV